MTFLTFGFVFAGITAAILPVLLHLLMRGRPKKLEFPPLRFIRQRLQANQRKFRLKHLILLVLRMITLILLGLTLARPLVRFSGTIGSQEAPVAAVIVFDTSGRMDYLVANQTRLDEAKSVGLWLLQQFPKESQIAVLSSQRIPDSFQVDLLAAQERIKRLSVTPAGRPVMESVIEAAKLLQKSELDRREIYILTDLTEPGWPRHLEILFRSAFDHLPEVSVYLLDVGVESPVNATVGPINLSAQVLSARSPLQLDLEFSHVGPKETRTAELYLTNPEEKKLGTETIEFPEGNSKITNVSFTLTDLPEGINQGVVRFTNNDSLAMDDAFYFTVEVQSPWNVLIAAPEPPEQYSQFLAEALQPTLWQSRGNPSFSIKTVSMASLEQISPQNLLNYRAIFLLDPSPLSPGCWKKLGDFAASGNGLGFFFGRHADPPDEFRNSSARELLGMTLKMQAHAPDGDVSLAPRQYEHPIFAPFRGVSSHDLPWNALPVFRYWQVDHLVEGTEIVVPYSDGRPAILTRPIGRGRLLVMTTPISDSLQQERFWNMIPTGEAFWLFLPLTEGIARYLVGVGDENFNFFAGQLATIRVKTDQLSGNYVVTPPQGDGLRVMSDQNREIIAFSGTEQVGNYRISAGGGPGQFRSGFSVNILSQEWNLARISNERLVELFGKRIQATRDLKKIETGITRSRTGRELFPVLMLFLLLVFGVEYLFANRFYGET